MSSAIDLIQQLQQPSGRRIVMLVLDGLGGLPRLSDSLTELEAARTPNLDAIAESGICGLHVPVRSGITPGSGPAHLALFGYDPTEFAIGRGVLSALGIDFGLRDNDVAVRGNFCTVDDSGVITDRRAGRISTERNRELVSMLRDGVSLPGAELHLQTIKEHRFLLVLRAEGLSDRVADTDPQQTGRSPHEPTPASWEAEKTSALVREFIDQAREVLQNQHPANMVVLRGFAQMPHWPTMQERYGLRSTAIAAYPMYRGLAKLIGMNVLPMAESFDAELEMLTHAYGAHDFFFVHYKDTDKAGEDGDFDKKVAAVEALDRKMPRILDLKPDVLIVTGDHSTPAVLGGHSWHPVPVVIAAQYCRPDSVKQFGERAFLSGGLGPSLPATDILPLALANALGLRKFGA
jgi:2,3-bisphosphoglycerate-independent phosphoglycerate mutase